MNKNNDAYNNCTKDILEEIARINKKNKIS